jgi:hypothetical protein
MSILRDNMLRSNGQTIVLPTLENHPDNLILFALASSSFYALAKEQWPTGILASLKNQHLQHLQVVDTFLSTQFYPDPSLSPAISNTGEVIFAILVSPMLYGSPPKQS